MGRFLYWVVEMISLCHSYFLRINDNVEYVFSDKELHFIVIGLLGMAILFVVYPLFKALSKNHIMTVAFIYVFTLIVVITFAIEIGQKVTNTGSMEFADIMFGVVGFIAMYIVFMIIRGIFHMIKTIIVNINKKNNKKL